MSRCFPRYVFTLLLLLGMAGLGDAEQVTVTGQVLGPEGKAVAGAEVFVVYWGPALERETGEGVSDDTGTFSFTLDVVHVGAPISVMAAKEGMALDWQYALRDEAVVLNLGANPVAASGRVVNAEGNAIAGAEVYVHELTRVDMLWSVFWPGIRLAKNRLLYDRTDEAGRYHITGLPPETVVGLTVRAKGWGRLKVDDMMPGEERGPRLILQPEATISGKVTYDGQPVAGVKVFGVARGGYGGEAEDITTEDGTYHLTQLHGGWYHIGVDAPEGLTGRINEWIRVRPGGDIADADVHLSPGGLIQGTVTNARTGQPVAGALVGGVSRGQGEAAPLARQLPTNSGPTVCAYPVARRKSTASAAGAPLRAGARISGWRWRW